jgi:hypothetical protein
MNSSELHNLVRIGLLKQELGDQAEIDGLLRSARARLKDAHKPELSAESRFDLAYNAAHAFALAALRWHGYRPDNKRYIVFQSLEHSLGVKPATWRVLDNCHRLRNLAEYEGFFDVGAQLLADLLQAAQDVGEAVEQLGPIQPRQE